MTSANNSGIIFLYNGEKVVVEEVQHEILESPVKVYNFEVADYHTYFVGETGVLVHNNCELEIPNEYTQDANGRYHRANGQFASNEEVGLPSTKKPTNTTHGNSLDNPNTNYGYGLIDRNGNVIGKGDKICFYVLVRKPVNLP